MNDEITALVDLVERWQRSHPAAYIEALRARSASGVADEQETLEYWLLTWRPPAASRPAPAPHAWPDCPDCGAEVLAWSDTVDGSAGAHCTGCGREFFAPLAAPAPAVGEAAHWRDMFQSKLAEAQRQGDPMCKFSMTQDQMRSIVASLAATPPTGEAERLRASFDSLLAFIGTARLLLLNGDAVADVIDELNKAAHQGERLLAALAPRAPLRDCTCLGSCNGPERLSPRYRCALAPRAPELCKGGHNYRRNAPPQAGDICTVCRVAVWQPGLPAHHGVIPSPGERRR